MEDHVSSWTLLRRAADVYVLFMFSWMSCPLIMGKFVLNSGDRIANIGDKLPSFCIYVRFK
jgi:hypothetical protein